MEKIKNNLKECNFDKEFRLICFFAWIIYFYFKFKTFQSLNWKKLCSIIYDDCESFLHTTSDLIVIEVCLKKSQFVNILNGIQNIKFKMKNNLF